MKKNKDKKSVTAKPVTTFEDDAVRARVAARVDNLEFFVGSLWDELQDQHAFNDDVSAFLDGQCEFNDEQRDSGEVIAKNFREIETACNNQFLFANQHRDRLDEVCDYLGVERVPTWFWNADKKEFETRYILRAASTASIPLARFFPGDGGPSIIAPFFQTRTIGGTAPTSA